jgi:hypothetical protein
MSRIDDIREKLKAYETHQNKQNCYMVTLAEGELLLSELEQSQARERELREALEHCNSYLLVRATVHGNRAYNCCGGDAKSGHTNACMIGNALSQPTPADETAKLERMVEALIEQLDHRQARPGAKVMCLMCGKLDGPHIDCWNTWATRKAESEAQK